MKNYKKELDIYRTEYGNGYLIFENDILVAHCLPGSKKPDGDFIIPRKAGILARKMEQYFEGKAVVFNDKISISGTIFEKKVLKACRKIPYGEVLTYKKLAAEMGSNAYRAAGNALSKNKLPVIIPCHRIVAKSGLGGWSGPKGMKEVLLDIERKTVAKS